MTKIVLVEWEDACAPDVGETWVARKKTHTWKPYMVQTVGFLIHDGPEGVILTESLTRELTGQRQQIPRGMIRRITELRPPTKRPTNAKSAA